MVPFAEYPDGRLEIQHEGHVLPYRQFDKMRQVKQPVIVENRHLDAALLLAKQIQAITPHHRQRNNNAPTPRPAHASVPRTGDTGEDRWTPVGRGLSSNAVLGSARRSYGHWARWNL
jgi:hypothetical protein